MLSVLEPYDPSGRGGELVSQGVMGSFCHAPYPSPQCLRLLCFEPRIYFLETPVPEQFLEMPSRILWTVEDQEFGQVQQCLGLFVAPGLHASLHRLREPQTFEDCQVMEDKYYVASRDPVGEEEVRQECSTVVHRPALNQPGSSESIGLVACSTSYRSRRATRPAFSHYEASTGSERSSNFASV